MVITEQQIMQWLEDVKDPEIPVLSLIDLGVITNVAIGENGKVTINMTPTFAGCPAIDYMKKDVEDVLTTNGVDDFEVIVSFQTQWNSNMISDKGREALKNFGLTPPPKHNMIIDLDIIKHVECPNCGSENTDIKTPFGPTLCRSIHYCHNCLETFQQFKPL